MAVHSVKLTWVPPVAGATVASYDVQRALVNAGVIGAYASIASPTAPSYTDLGPFVEGQTYEYQVMAVNAGGESVPCPAVAAKIPFSVPDAPTNLVAVAA